MMPDAGERDPLLACELRRSPRSARGSGDFLRRPPASTAARDRHVGAAPRGRKRCGHARVASSTSGSSQNRPREPGRTSCSVPPEGLAARGEASSAATASAPTERAPCPETRRTSSSAPAPPGGGRTGRRPRVRRPHRRSSPPATGRSCRGRTPARALTLPSAGPAEGRRRAGRKVGDEASAPIAWQASARQTFTTDLPARLAAKVRVEREHPVHLGL